MMTCAIPACGKPVLFGNRAGENRLSCLGGHDLVLIVGARFEALGAQLNAATADSLTPEAASS